MSGVKVAEEPINDAKAIEVRPARACLKRVAVQLVGIKNVGWTDDTLVIAGSQDDLEAMEDLLQETGKENKIEVSINAVSAKD